ncbi:unnamed protein product, partial [marine sediment metagenome]
DTGNWKFRFPRAHRFAYTRLHSAEEYTRRYVDCENGLFGDIQVGKGEHEHFTPESLSQLLRASGFCVETVDGAGRLGRPLGLVKAVLPSGLRQPVDRLIEADQVAGESVHLFATARRI